MRSLHLSILVAAGVLLAGCGAQSPTASPTPSSSPVTQATPTATPTNTGAFSGTITDLLAMGGNRQCTWSFDVGGKTQTGTTYTAGTRMASEGTIQVEKLSMKMNMVGDADEIKMWMEAPGMGKIGSVIKPKEMAAQANATSTPAQTDATREKIMQKMNFNCVPWLVDESKFVVPTDVRFMAPPVKK